jgi:hypothetical protein
MDGRLIERVNNSNLPGEPVESWARRSVLFGGGGVHASKQAVSLSRDVLPHRRIC